MGIIVDTSVLVAHERGSFDLDGYLATFEQGDAAISAITASELLHGVERTRDDAWRAERAESVNDVLDALQVVPFGLTEARRHAQVWAQLKGVYDPEIPVDIVNLGLVYDCAIDQVEERKVVQVKMTLTAPGCGMGPVIAADAQAKIMTIDGIDDAKVELVWDPPWNQDMISEEGKMKLGMV